MPFSPPAWFAAVDGTVGTTMALGGRRVLSASYSTTQTTKQFLSPTGFTSLILSCYESDFPGMLTAASEGYTETADTEYLM